MAKSKSGSKAKVQEAEVVSSSDSSSGTSSSGQTDWTEIAAIGALIIGVMNLCSWCLPLCGCPLSIIGIVLGVVGMKNEERKTLAIIGLVLSAVALILTLVNGLLGVVLDVNDYVNY